MVVGIFFFFTRKDEILVCTEDVQHLLLVVVFEAVMDDITSVITFLFLLYVDNLVDNVGLLVVFFFMLLCLGDFFVLDVKILSLDFLLKGSDVIL